jgi:hypothetical protein
MIRIRNRTLSRELSWFAVTVVSFFALFWALDLGGGPGDPFDWIAALCLYVCLMFVRITAWVVKSRRPSN